MSDIRLPWWLKYVNKVMIGLQKLGILGEKGPVVRTVPGRPTGVDFIKNAGLVTGPNPDEFEALAGRCPVFRIDKVTP